jgi:hypothetical protein
VLVIIANAAVVARMVGDVESSSPALAGAIATLGLASVGFLCWIR